MTAIVTDDPSNERTFLTNTIMDSLLRLTNRVPGRIWIHAGSKDIVYLKILVTITGYQPRDMEIEGNFVFLFHRLRAEEA